MTKPRKMHRNVTMENIKAHKNVIRPMISAVEVKVKKKRQNVQVDLLLCFRCNIAVILLTDLIVDHGVKVEWSAYLHLLLHAIFIGNSLVDVARGPAWR